MLFEALLLNIVTVFFTSIAAPWVISRRLSEPLSKRSAAAVVGINAVVCICIWIGVREVAVPKPGPSTPTYVLYGISLSMFAGWSMLTGRKSAPLRNVATVSTPETKPNAATLAPANDRIGYLSETSETPDELICERRLLQMRWFKGVRELDDDAMLAGLESRITEIDDLLWHMLVTNIGSRGTTAPPSS